MSRARGYVFTLNNYTEDERDAVRGLEVAYMVFGYERGEGGTPHLQGCVQWKAGKTLSACKKLLPRAHWETRKGSIDQAVEYCKKEGDYEEKGEKPMNQKEKGAAGKAAMREIVKRARDGDEEWLLENHPGEYYRHLATFRSHKKPKVEVMEYSETPHEWWVGPTGTGKSRWLWDQYPEHYRKDQNKWWCGYTGQDVVAIEEASPETMQMLASRLKIWADRYPFDGEIKGGKIHGIRPKKVIVLSNYTIEQCFKNPEDVEPLLRRFRVKRFGEPVSAWAKDVNKFM